MAIKVETLEVDIKVDGATKAATDVKGVTNNTDKMASSMKAAAVQAAALYAAFKVGVRILKDVYGRVVDQDTANRQLRNTLRITGAEVDSTFARFEEFAGSVQKLTGLADDSTLTLLAQATQMGLTADAAEEATRQAIGLSTAFGTNVNSALKIAALAGEGNYEMLARLVPELRNATTEAEKAAIAQRVLNQSWEVATERTESLAGATENLSNSFGDVIEAVVDAAVDMDNLIGLINDVSAAFQRIAADENLGKVVEGFKFFNQYVSAVINPLGALSRGILKLAGDNDAYTASLDNQNIALNTKNELTLASMRYEALQSNNMIRFAQIVEEEEKRAAAWRESRRIEIIDLGETEKAINGGRKVDIKALLAADLEAEAAKRAARKANHEEEVIEIEDIAARRQAALQTAASYVSTLGGLVSQFYANEIQAAGANEVELKKIREKQFKANKAFATAEVILNTAVAVSKVWGQTGLAGIIAQAVPIAMGIAQIALINSAKPSFATGGSYTVPPGYEGDNFPVMAASGETVTVERPGQESGQMLNAAINIDGYEFGRVITRLFEDRKAVISGVNVA